MRWSWIEGGSRREMEVVDWAAAKIKGGGRIEFGSGGDPEVGGGVAAVTRRMGQIS